MPLPGRSFLPLSCLVAVINMKQLLTQLREKHWHMFTGSPLWPANPSGEHHCFHILLYNPGSPEAHVGLILPLSLPTAGLQARGQSAKCAAASEDSSKAGAPGLFSAMTASLALVPHLPKECFWRGEIFTWIYEYRRICLNTYIMNRNHQLALCWNE